MNLFKKERYMMSEMNMYEDVTKKLEVIERKLLYIHTYIVNEDTPT